MRWFAQAARDLPWRLTRDPYAIWVSEIMLQQTQVQTVLGFWERWMRELPDIRSLAEAPLQKVLKLWEGLGYYRRARHLHQAATWLLQNKGARFPTDFGEVLALPGIGAYTAGAICSIAFHQPAPILDGNVVRVLTRLFAITGNPGQASVRRDLWELSSALVQRAVRTRISGDSSAVANRQLASTPGCSPNCSAFNQALMELGAIICTPRRPACRECPVGSLCAARRSGLVHRLPNLDTRPAPVPRRIAGFVLERGGKLFVRQRSGELVNGGLWEFPNAEVRHFGASELRRAANESLGRDFVAGPSLATIRHSIMHFRITMQIFRIHCDDPLPEQELNGRWLGRTRISQLPFPSAHRKVLGLILGQ